MSKKSGKTASFDRNIVDMLGSPDATTLESIGLGIHVVDSDLQIVYANRQLVRMFKGTEIGHKEIIGRNIKEVFPFLTKSVINEYREVLQKGKSKYKKSSPINVGDREIIAEVRKIPLKQGDKTTRILTTIRDVTEVIENREALAASEEKYRLLVENVSATIAVIDHDGVFLFLNRIGAEALGMTADEIIGKNQWDVFPKEIADPQMENIRKVIDENTEFVEETMLIVNNQRKWYLVNLQPYTSTDGKTVAAMLIAHDVTNQRISDEALQHSEETFRLAMESTEDALWDWNMVTNHVYRNPRHATMLGYAPDEMPPDQEEWAKIVHPDDRENVFKVLKDTVRQKKDGFELEYRLRAKSGDYIWVLGRGKVVTFAPDGTSLRMVGTNTDITKRKKAREALSASEERYRLLVENVQADISLVDHDGVFLFVNESTARSMGMKSSDMVGMNQAEYFPPKSAARQLKNIRKVIDKEINFREEVQTIIGGKKRWFDVNIHPYRAGNRKTVAALIIAIDITHRREADKALRESEERYRRQFEYLPIPTYTWEFGKNDFVLVECNKAAHTITKGLIKDYLGSNASEMYAHLPGVVDDMSRCLKEKISHTREMTYKFISTGENKHLIVHYVYTPPNHVVVHTEDLTERKNAENALKKAHSELETRVERRTRELAEANEALEVERELLNQKNIAMREVLDQIEEGKKQMASDIQSNINRIVLPILKSLESKVAPAGRTYVDLLQSSLDDITSPLMSTLELKSAQLTPRELEICNMVRSGLSSKEIATTLNTSAQTVLKQRTRIRKKLGLSNSQTNLASYLKSLE